MSFFEKIFTKKFDNSTSCKSRSQNCSTLLEDQCNKQVRVLLLRECEKRGRKVLFDSNSVEKILLASEDNLNGNHCKKLSEFIEVSGLYGYKYNKLQNDVKSIGEMMFGTVAMMYKGDSISKLHKMSSPPQVMFTTIVNAPMTSRCNTDSDQSWSSYDSSNHSQQESSCSDSKLYNSKNSNYINSGTYPILNCTIKTNTKLTNCDTERLCTRNQNLLMKKTETIPKIKTTESSLHKSKTDFSLNNLEDAGNADNIESIESEPNLNTSWGRKEYEHKSRSEFDKIAKIGQRKQFYNSEDIKTDNSHQEILKILSVESKTDRSSGYGSYSSPSCQFSCSSSNRSHSLNSSHGNSSNSMPYSINIHNSQCTVNSKTKLGIALILVTKNDSIEQKMFERIQSIELIINKLVSAVQAAYLQKRRFVDILYTGFIDCKESIFELTRHHHNFTSMWTQISSIASVKMFKKEANSVGNWYQQFQENFYNMGIGSKNNKRELNGKPDTKEKFVHDLCYLLVHYDTKETNFFISTLITAVLTHHLSWLPTIAKNTFENTNTDQGQDPISIQLNNLRGCLGSSRKTSQTVVAGSDRTKKLVSNTVEMLSYFFRFSNIKENTYDFKSVIDDVSESCDILVKKSKTLKKEYSKIGFEKMTNSLSFGKQNGEKSKNNEAISADSIKDVLIYLPLCDKRLPSVDDSSVVEAFECLETNCDSQSNENIYKPEKTFSVRKLYPSIEDLAKIENICLTDLRSDNYGSNSDKSEVKTNVLDANKLCLTKVHKLMRIPSKVVQSTYSGEYDAVDSTVPDCPKKGDNVQSKAGVLFLIGENDKLGGLKKTLTVKSSKIEIEPESSDVLLNIEKRQTSIQRSNTISIPISHAKKHSARRRVGSTSGSIQMTMKLKTNSVDEALKLKNDSIEKQNSSNGIAHDVSPATVIPLPRLKVKSPSRKVDFTSPVLGNINSQYKSEQILQGVVSNEIICLNALRKDLKTTVRNSPYGFTVKEAICIIANVNCWDVSIHSSDTCSLDKNHESSVKVGMSQLVSDMLESLLHLYQVKAPVEFILKHLERKLHEFYLKGLSLSEMLLSTDYCSIEGVMKSLDVGVNDIPLLLSIATASSPQIAERYGISYY